MHKKPSKGFIWIEPATNLSCQATIPINMHNIRHNHSSRRMSFQKTNLFFELCWSPEIVMIKKRYETPIRQLNSTISGLGNTSVLKMAVMYLVPECFHDVG